MNQPTLTLSAKLLSVSPYCKLLAQTLAGNTVAVAIQAVGVAGEGIEHILDLSRLALLRGKPSFARCLVVDS